ncbi:hypothetical protein B0H63DRAFT_445832 [Podospora didyma]|uniref:DUF6603 domain-containing protein n=1 Tax=Podospora didyma TaxID=330526 RepID=A0AAE0U3W1_9PEZI|nr:hypothetical protein B0H63DRAFT_445832 [Podospora didyma]
MGLSITVDFKGIEKIEDLMTLQTSRIQLSIEGLAVAFEKPPTTRLSGAFYRFSDKGFHGYMGAIEVSMGAWSAIAQGMYEQSDSVESLFVFGMAKGPLFTIGCAEVVGLTGGFGFNSHLTLSGVEQVPDFPFVAMNTNRKNPAEGGVLGPLLETTGRGIVTTMADSLWFIAGLGLRAFQSVDAQAIFALDLSSEPKFSIIAQATAVFPKNPTAKASEVDKAFLVLELGLTPRCLILHPSCRLTGGFALAIFFDGSGHDDFVLTVAMGGAWLDIVLNKSWVRAMFRAYADFMRFHPFEFEADLHATLNLHGPPIAGTAHLHLWRWDVTLCFGAPRTKEAELNLDQIIRMVKNLQDGQSDDLVPNHVLSLKEGVVLAPSTKPPSPDEPIQARGAGFRFEVATRVLVTAVQIGGGDVSFVEKEVEGGQKVRPQLLAAPMQLDSAVVRSGLRIQMPPALWGAHTNSAADAVKAWGKFKRHTSNGGKHRDETDAPMGGGGRQSMKYSKSRTTGDYR